MPGYRIVKFRRNSICDVGLIVEGDMVESIRFNLPIPVHGKVNFRSWITCVAQFEPLVKDLILKFLSLFFIVWSALFRTVDFLHTLLPEPC